MYMNSLSYEYLFKNVYITFFLLKYVQPIIAPDPIRGHEGSPLGY